MAKYQLGDEIRIIEGGDYRGCSPLHSLVGQVGIISSIEEDDRNGLHYRTSCDSRCIPETQIELIKDRKITTKKLMTKLTTMMKKLLDSDTQTLVKAGYINGDLEPTDTGNSALMTILFLANKPALVADAQTVIDAETK